MFDTKYSNAYSDFRPSGSQLCSAQPLEAIVGGSPYGKVIKFSSSYPLYTFNAIGNNDWSNVDAFGNRAPDEAPVHEVNVTVQQAKTPIAPIITIGIVSVVVYVIYKFFK